jgi:integrase
VDAGARHEGGSVSPFKRGAFWSLYVPRRSGGVVQRATGTTDKKLADRMGRMIETLADQRRWDVLDAIDAKRVTVPEVWDAYAMNGLDTLMARASAVNLAHLVEPWLASLHHTPGTIAGYRTKIEALIPASLLAADVTEGWIVDRITAIPFTGTTKGLYLAVLTLFLDYAVAHRAMPTNPARNKALVKRPRPNPARRVWKSAADDLRLVNAAPEPFRSYFALVHATGAERDAALRMRRRDVDLTAWTVHIPGTKRATRDRRGVPVDSWARPLVSALCAGKLPDALLFPGMRRTVLNYAHRDAREAVGLDGYFLRDARHSFAVRHLLAGVPLWKVSKWLGHNNVKTTAEVYTRFELDEAMEMLGALAKVEAK